MVFSSVAFLFYFLPAVLGSYALVTKRWRNLVLLGASFVFHLWGSGALVGLLVASIAVAYVAGFLAARAAATHDRLLAGVAIGITVVTNVALLGWFKYGSWLVEALADIGIFTGTVPETTVPIGISIFTFQSMSYTIDVARGRSDHLANPLDLALYISFFPQVLAGPIVRYHQIESQLQTRLLGTAQFGEGAVRFAHGLVKKVVVADTIAPLADAAFAADDLTTTAAWVGALAFTLQIYFSLSGYADMAIGLGRMFGFRLPENFDRPYSAVSITDFWQRWLMSLTSWFRDYVYIPLGGDRTDRAAAAYRGLLLVFLLTGLWHGAGWTFVVWGLYHGVLLVAERYFRLRRREARGAVAVARRAGTFLVVLVGWVVFRAPSLADAFDHLVTMVSLDGFGLGRVARAATTRSVATLALACLVVVIPPRFAMGPILMRYDDRPIRLARGVVMGVLLPFAVLLVASGAASPFPDFIY